MGDRLNSLAVFARPEESIDTVIRRISEKSRVVEHAGLAVVVDSGMKVKGSGMALEYASFVPVIPQSASISTSASSRRIG